MQNISLGNKDIGTNLKPFIVAEMSGNHNQSLSRALELVDAAADAGVDALKIQTYTAETMTLNIPEREFSIRDPKSLWNNKSLHQLYKEAYTPWEWHPKIFERCHARGISCFSTPFDASAVDFLEKMNAPFYKVASFENTDIPLIEKIAGTKKPMIISTGMATVSELEESVKAARKAGCEKLILLKCTSTYPATPTASNISTIPHMRDLFQCHIGLSDHSMGVGVAVASVVLGAVLIEKHFTLKRSDGGVDSSFSLEPDELKSLVVETTRAWQSIGKVCYGTTEDEEKSLQFRRSLYVVSDMKAGDEFSLLNLRSIRPGLGLPPKHLNEFLGKQATRNLPKGTPLHWDCVHQGVKRV